MVKGHGHKNNINPFWGMPNGQKKVQTPGGVVAGYDDFSMVKYTPIYPGQQPFVLTDKDAG